MVRNGVGWVEIQGRRLYQLGLRGLCLTEYLIQNDLSKQARKLLAHETGFTYSWGSGFQKCHQEVASYPFTTVLRLGLGLHKRQDGVGSASLVSSPIPIPSLRDLGQGLTISCWLWSSQVSLAKLIPMAASLKKKIGT